MAKGRQFYQPSSTCCIMSEGRPQEGFFGPFNMDTPCLRPRRCETGQVAGVAPIWFFFTTGRGSVVRAASPRPPNPACRPTHPCTSAWKTTWTVNCGHHPRLRRNRAQAMRPAQIVDLMLRPASGSSPPRAKSSNFRARPIRRPGFWGRTKRCSPPPFAGRLGRFFVGRDWSEA